MPKVNCYALLEKALLQNCEGSNGHHKRFFKKFFQNRKISKRQFFAALDHLTAWEFAYNGVKKNSPQFLHYKKMGTFGPVNEKKWKDFFKAFTTFIRSCGALKMCKEIDEEDRIVRALELANELDRGYVLDPTTHEKYARWLIKGKFKSKLIRDLNDSTTFLRNGQILIPMENWKVYQRSQ